MPTATPIGSFHNHEHRLRRQVLDVAVDLGRPPAEVLEHERDLVDVLARIADRFARVERFHPGQALVFATDDVGGAEQDPPPLAGGGARPPSAVVKGPAGGIDGDLHVDGLGVRGVAITSPVAGSKTSKRSPSRASTHLPSMKFCNASATALASRRCPE